MELEKTLRGMSLALVLAATLASRVGADPGKHPPVTARVGAQPDGSVLLPTNQRLEASGQQIEFPGRPVALAVHPNGRTAAVLDAYYHSIVVIDLETLTVKQEFADAGVSASFAGLTYSRDGRTLYASQAKGRIVRATVAQDGTLALAGFITCLPRSSASFPGREDGDPYPGGLALASGGSRLVVALSRNNSIAIVDPVRDKLIREIPVGNAPHAVVVHGTKAYVSNQGGRRARSTDFTADSSGTPIVADPSSAFATTGTVSVVDLTMAKVVKEIEVGLQPTSLLANGDRLFVANTNGDSVSSIDLRRDQVVKTIATTPFPGALIGSSPNALAITQDGRLAVALGRNNALALYDVDGPAFRQATFSGLIPTGWYPTDVAFDRKRRRLVVANAKGRGVLGPGATIGPDPISNRSGKWVHSYLGSVSVIDLPPDAQLPDLTRAVFENNRWGALSQGGAACAAPGTASRTIAPQPIPACTGDPSVFKHVFYVIKENRTYDQILGDLRQGNGDPHLTQFGRDVTPNHHALAEEFVLLDNFYDSGSLSADGHQWVTQALVTDYLEKSFGGFVRSYPFNGGDALAYAPTGFLWDNAIRHGKSVRVYGEYVNGLRADGIEMGPWPAPMLGHGETTAGTWNDFYRDAQLLAAGRDREIHTVLEAHTDIPSLGAVINPKYPPFHEGIPDQYRAEVFLHEFEQYVAHGNLPDLVVMTLTSDHTQGTTPEYPTPRAMVADNDLALGRVVDAISHSPYWRDSVIFVIEDDAQDGVDHIDGHRMPGFVISPYTRRHAVDSHFYTQIDAMRTIEQVLGLPPMNQMDTAVEATSMRHVFTARPDFTPYRARASVVPLNELNAPLSALNGLRKAWATASRRMDFSKPDVADERLLNRAIWYSTTGFTRPYPGDARMLSPREVVSSASSEREDDVRR